MGVPKFAQVIPIRSRRRPSQSSSGQAVSQADPFLYTLDLLMEDFGKRHQKESCALCEPMQTLGRHRDDMMVELTEALFLAFFPSFESYVQEVKEGLLQGLLDRRDRKAYVTWQEKLKDLLERQVLADLGDFLNDLKKHLAKFAGIELEEERREAILNQVMARLEKHWLLRAPLKPR